MKTIIYFFLLASILIFIISCENKESKPLTAYDSISIAQHYLALNFEKSEVDSLQENLKNYRKNYLDLREDTLKNSVPPSLYFIPGLPNKDISQNKRPFRPQLTFCSLPDNKEELAFYTVAQLAYLIKQKEVTSVELTWLFLDRLKKYGDTLQCVITLTDSMALAQARRADDELSRGIWRGPLHGIPYGAKDLLAAPPYKTTWGAKPFSDQILNEKATVVRKLEEAGAVLVAKLTLGALAWGDVWYGGVTKNPWNMQQGSSGSSAGSASATSAGLVPFAIGTETWGSIVSPSTRCGVTGLRPSFGSVSRYGAMALSWSMDKIGPICRSAYDCAIVYNVIRGKDEKDKSVVEKYFFEVPGSEIPYLKVGYAKNLFEASKSRNDSIALAVLKESGIMMDSVSLPSDIPLDALSLILSAEAAAAFDLLTRSNIDSTLVRQIKNAWPNVFRSARFIPALEYIQANRWRTLLIQHWKNLFENYDVIIAPSFGGNQLLSTNLSGHPCVVVPNGFNETGSPTSISFISALHDEGSALALAQFYQERTGWDAEIPPFFRP
jgi:Asp-tRNA(Asn)/Glu-tRNA(Gln) amidotransferase A subunit family amidase